MILPSRELLREVLKYREVFKVIIDKPNIVEFDIGCNHLSSINIHELNHELKKWAWSKLGYEIVQYVDVVKVISGSKELYESVYDIEYDVNEIIKAAQWIYDKNFKA